MRMVYVMGYVWVKLVRQRRWVSAVTTATMYKHAFNMRDYMGYGIGRACYAQVIWYVYARTGVGMCTVRCDDDRCRCLDNVRWLDCCCQVYGDV